MKARSKTRWLLAVAGAALVAVPLVGERAIAQTPAAPPGGSYVEIPGSPDAVLNPAHRGSLGSAFQQGQCPIPVPQGGVVWHFVLPQNDRASEFSPDPANIFTSLTVEFRAAGEVTLTTFGPPSAMHAYIATTTDDVLIDGEADGATRTPPAFPPQFNLSHTCASPNPIPPPSSTTTAPPSSTTSTSVSLGTLPIEKRITGPLAGSQDPITMEIDCSAPNGDIPSWKIPASATGTQSTLVTGITVPAVCIITELETGQSSGVVVGRGTSRAIRQSIEVCPVGRRARNAAASQPVVFENVVDTTQPATTQPPGPTTTTGPGGTAPTTTGGPTTTTGGPTTTDGLSPSTSSGVCGEIDSSVPTLPETGASTLTGSALGTFLALVGVLLIAVAVAVPSRRRPTTGD